MGLTQHFELYHYSPSISYFFFFGFCKANRKLAQVTEHAQAITWELWANFDKSNVTFTKDIDQNQREYVCLELESAQFSLNTSIFGFLPCGKFE